jgi:MYXO-CTERM domain-containing protein
MIGRTAAASLLLALAPPTGAQAATLPSDGQWLPFDVAPDLSGNLGWIDIADGSALSFTFTVPSGFVATLSVVDGGFAGDRFQVFNGASVLGATSAAINSYPNSIGLDFEAALVNAAYSRAVFTLPSGAYNVSGVLLASALDDTGAAINSTVGGVRLTISPVPEPASWLLTLAGVGLLGALRRRAHP